MEAFLNVPLQSSQSQQAGRGASCRAARCWVCTYMIIKGTNKLDFSRVVECKVLDWKIYQAEMNKVIAA